MGGLILLLAALLQEPAAPPWQADLARLEGHLGETPSTVSRWNARVYALLRRLEHAPEETVLKGWQLLAENGGDAGRANLLLYQRRHRLPMEAVDAMEGPESLLERALALWGERRLQAAREALEAAASRFPQDARFRDNLLWLDLEPPARISRDATPRQLALAVLASRNSSEPTDK